MSLAPPLEREDANDEQNEDREEGEVEAREHRRVPDGEGGEGCPAGDDEPDLVSVPDRPDRLEHRPPVFLASAEDGEEHPDAEVEAFGDEVARPEDAERAEPEGFQSHLNRPAPVAAPLLALAADLGRIEPSVAARIR